MIVDAHVHLVDPRRHPVPAGPGYKPRAEDRGSSTELDAALGAAGVTHAVVVALSGYGADHRPVLDGVADRPERRRGVVNLAPGMTIEDLDALLAAGVVGLRVNVTNHGEAAMVAARALAPAAAERGLLVQLQCPAARLGELDGAVDPRRARVVLDHFGLPDPARGAADEGFRRLLRWGERGATLKLSGAFRVSALPFPYADLGALAPALLAAFGPERRVWGSDWPFVGLAEKPGLRAELDLARALVPDEAERRLLFAANPARLFGFAQG